MTNLRGGGFHLPPLNELKEKGESMFSTFIIYWSLFTFVPAMLGISAGESGYVGLSMVFLIITLIGAPAGAYVIAKKKAQRKQDNITRARTAIKKTINIPEAVITELFFEDGLYTGMVAFSKDESSNSLIYVVADIRGDSLNTIKEHCRVYLDTVLECSIVKDNKVIQESHVLSNTIVGGVLGGGIGAAVGATSAPANTVVLHQYYIRVVTSDPNNPCIVLPFPRRDTKDITDFVNTMYSIITAAIYNNRMEEQAAQQRWQQVKENPSERLRRLDEMYTQGYLTLDEYYAKRQQIVDSL